MDDDRKRREEEVNAEEVCAEEEGLASHILLGKSFIWAIIAQSKSRSSRGNGYEKGSLLTLTGENMLELPWNLKEVYYLPTITRSKKNGINNQLKSTT